MDGEVATRCGDDILAPAALVRAAGSVVALTGAGDVEEDLQALVAALA